MAVLSYRLQREMVPDDILEWVDELFVRMCNQDWHGIQLTMMANGKFTIDVQLVDGDD